MVLTKFCTMLLGAVLHVHTDHLNITTNNTTPDLVIHWLNYIEQFNPYIHFISGKDNVIANTLSWLDCLEESILSKDKQVLFLKTLSPKGWTLPMIHCSLNVSFTCHLWQCKTQTLLIITGYLIIKMKLMNLSYANRNFQTDTSTKF